MPVSNSAWLLIKSAGGLLAALLAVGLALRALPAHNALAQQLAAPVLAPTTATAARRVAKSRQAARRPGYFRPPALRCTMSDARCGVRNGRGLWNVRNNERYGV